MALINTLRNRMGKLLVVVIGFSILAFVLADFLQNGSLFTGNQTEVGEIAGKTISIEEFQAVVQERESSYVLNFGRQPTERERPTLRQQAWDFLVAKYAFDKQYGAVGSDVTTDEIWDMLQGKNINPSLKQTFTNPATGEYDRGQFMTYLQQLPTMDQNARVQWELFKTELIQARVRLKYENLLTKTNYITEAESKREYNAQNDIAEIEYLYVPYFSVSDSTVTVDEGTAKEYYNNNKDRYKVEASRSLKYVSFDIVPSSMDSSFVKEELQLLREEFKTAENDSAFAALNSDALTFFGKYHIGTLPAQLKGNVSNLTQGDVRGPYLESEGYKLYKVSEIFEDTIGYARASHILIKGEDDEARANAQDILNQIKNGADFAAMAREHGTDGSANVGGDLGWFESGKMVAEFEEAVFKATQPGLLNNLVKTQFGYHIVKVDEVKTNTAYKIATVTREILPGDETINNAYAEADMFATAVDDIASFDERVATDSLRAMPAAKLKANDRRIGVMGEARAVVQWLYSKASVGDVSDVFELDNAYVVAVMTSEVEEGTKSFSTVKNEVINKLKKDEQGKVIADKLNALSGSLAEKANAYGDDANVYTQSDLKLSTTSLPSVGFDPIAIGSVFALESGETSAPIMGENGVVVVRMDNKTIAPDVADYSIFKSQLEQQVNGRVGYGISEAIKDAADIQDERYRFY